MGRRNEYQSKGGDVLRLAYGVCLQVTLCDPYLSALEAFAHKRAIQIDVYFTLLCYKVIYDHLFYINNYDVGMEALPTPIITLLLLLLL